MQHDEFIQRVQKYAGLDSSDEAVAVTEAVLSTLGERLYRTEQSDVASQLPRGIKEFLVARQKPENTRADVQHFSLEEFKRRVSARAGTRYPEGARLTHAVMKVLQEAVSAGEIADMRQALPKDYDALFEESA
jgi:uncharacterized protein (DUF2267 family)